MADQMDTVVDEAFDLSPGESFQRKVTVLGVEYVITMSRLNREVDKLLGLTTVRHQHIDVDVDGVSTDSHEWALSERTLDAGATEYAASRLRGLLLEAHANGQPMSELVYDPMLVDIFP